MCGRFTLRTPASVLVRQFTLGTELQRPPRYNIAPTQQVPVIRAADGVRQLAMMKWGLISSWANDPKIGYSLINARSETAATDPSFRAALRGSRCFSHFYRDAAGVLLGFCQHIDAIAANHC
jgi:putative SOS response-associated peptidase YedK